jgi:hypothetical protein
LAYISFQRRSYEKLIFSLLCMGNEKENQFIDPLIRKESFTGANAS